MALLAPLEKRRMAMEREYPQHRAGPALYEGTSVTRHAAA